MYDIEYQHTCMWCFYFQLQFRTTPPIRLTQKRLIKESSFLWGLLTSEYCCTLDVCIILWSGCVLGQELSRSAAVNVLHHHFAKMLHFTSFAVMWVVHRLVFIRYLLIVRYFPLICLDFTRCKPARDFLLSHSTEWQWAVGWLRKKVVDGFTLVPRLSHVFQCTQEKHGKAWAQGYIIGIYAEIECSALCSCHLTTINGHSPVPYPMRHLTPSPSRGLSVHRWITRHPHLVLT